MKKLWLLLPVALLLILGCTAQDDTGTERQEFRRQIESQLAEFDKKTQDAKNRSEGLSGDARDKVDGSMAEMEESRAALASKLEDMKSAGNDEWEASKRDLQEASQNLEQAFSNLQEALEEASSQIY